MNIRYRQLRQEDEALLQDLFHLYVEVFEAPYTPPGIVHFSNLLQQENILFFIATNGTIIGGLTAHVLPSVYSEASEVYLYDLAVKKDFQRQGIGKQLLNVLGHWCKEHSVKEFFVQADNADAHAMAFYRATGGHPESVTHFSYATEN
ncbi:GNAT family N-acetyltransferase [Niabella aurantiaca]|uniref:GNAT family N-acetyltransferase n=1 Tax=Niabella aurantiaca TaxID=379900 RepID=UPI0003670E58|nr:GNAT family N-acetyltransferase [Niabella aurantiaca]